MKKYLGNLLFFITAFVMILFGCTSMTSKAATTMKPAEDVKFVKDHVHFKAAEDGYYTVILECFHEKGEYGKAGYFKGVTCEARKVNQFYKANEIVDYSTLLFNERNYNVYQINLHVVSSKEKKVGYEYINKYKNNPNYVISTYTTPIISKRMAKPQNVEVKYLDPVQHTDYFRYKVSWKNDGCYHIVETPYNRCSVDPRFNSVNVITKTPIFRVRTCSGDFNVYKTSDPAIVDFTAPSKNSDPDEAAPKAESKPAIPALPTTVTVDDITYYIDVNGQATATKIDSKKKASLDTVTVDGKNYPVVAIAESACKNNKKIKTVTIGSNVSSIGKKAFFKCKKLKKIIIKANKNLKIGKSAFKKINKGATIKIKGVKGNAKKKLIKAINK